MDSERLGKARIKRRASWSHFDPRITKEELPSTEELVREKDLISLAWRLISGERGNCSDTMSQIYRVVHYIYCRLCRHRFECTEWTNWKRVGLRIVRTGKSFVHD